MKCPKCNSSNTTIELDEKSDGTIFGFLLCKDCHYSE